MKKIKTGRIICFIVFIGFFLMTTGIGCNSEKKCGCGPDLYGLYKVKRKYRSW